MSFLEGYYPWFVCIAVFAVAEHLYPSERKQRFWRADSGQNFFYLVLNEILNTAWARIGGVVLLLRWIGLGTLVSGQIPWINAFARWPLWGQFVLILFVADFFAWLLHYIAHRNRFLSRFHILHHSSETLDWLAAFRSHWVDANFTELALSLPLAILPVDDKVVMGLGLVDLFLTFFNHSNIRLELRKNRPSSSQVFGWICSPVAHRWHHSAVCHLPHGQNFGFVTLIWDRLFGTLYLPTNEAAPKRLGLLYQRRYSPKILTRLLGPFLPRACDLAASSDTV